jgi:hypothetical protein
VKIKIKINNNPTVKGKMTNNRTTPEGWRIIKKTPRISSQLGSNFPHRIMSLITSRVRMKDQMRRMVTLAVLAPINKTPTKWQAKVRRMII